jgi:hypothetical protein
VGEPQVSDAEKERLLAEIGVEPSTVMIRRREENPPPPPPPSEAPPPLPAPAPPPRLAFQEPAAPPAAPRRPSWIWAHRHPVAGFLTLAAGSAWMAMWLASGRATAGVLAALGVAAGAWSALRPKKA